MLLNFRVENWMSYRDEIVFSMVASGIKKHSERIARLKDRTRVLPVAAIYGSNAAGKTAFFKAMETAKFLTMGFYNVGSLLPVIPFRLNSKNESLPTKFYFEIFTDDRTFEYSFSVTSKAVIEEKLVQIRSVGKQILFERRDGEVSLNKFIQWTEALPYIANGTPDNMLVLTNTVQQKEKAFLPVYSWFRSTLELVNPNSTYEPTEQILDDEEKHSSMARILEDLDTGIVDIGGEPISFDQILLPPELKKSILDHLGNNGTIRIRTNPGHEIIIATAKEGKVEAKRVVAYHHDDSGNRVLMNFSEESDGTMRLIDLIPMFQILSDQKQSKVYVIDELDRSLHTKLTKGLLRWYFESCSANSRNQLIFTAHDLQLMDQSLFRQDEMWIVDRNSDGVSDLHSICEYSLRYDKDIRKSYLYGRFGGIPKILLSGSIGKSNSDTSEVEHE